MKVASRWEKRGASRVEVFTIDGVDYVIGSPADYVHQTSIGPVNLRRLDTLPSPKTVLCFRHKAYQAKRKPRSNCPDCWTAYNNAKGEAA